MFQFMVVLPPERCVTMTPPVSSRRILRADVSLAHGQDLTKSSNLSGPVSSSRSSTCVTVGARDQPQCRPPGSRETFRFGDFELDVAAYELRRLGRPVKLGRQPMDLLILLVEGRRQLVSRNEIVDRLWGKDVFVDVDTGVNTAISKIRQVLRDSPDAPAFVETVPGKGYRFIATVESVSVAAESAAGVRQQEPSLVPDKRESLRSRAL